MLADLGMRIVEKHKQNAAMVGENRDFTIASFWLLEFARRYRRSFTHTLSFCDCSSHFAAYPYSRAGNDVLRGNQPGSLLLDCSLSTTSF